MGPPARRERGRIGRERQWREILMMPGHRGAWW